MRVVVRQGFYCTVYKEPTAVVGLEGMTSDEFRQGVAHMNGSAFIPYCSLWRQIESEVGWPKLMS